MTGTLNVTTMIGVPVATTAGGSLLTDTATNYKTDDDGNVTESKIVPKGAIASSLITTGTTGSYACQKAEEQKTLNEIYAAQMVVESMSQEELEAALIQLGELPMPNSHTEETKRL